MSSIPTIKVAILGTSAVGKTCIMNRYFHNTFQQTVHSLSGSFNSKKITVDAQTVELTVWDTIGEEKYKELCKIYYRNSKAVIICYDLTDENSWDMAKEWVAEVQKNEERAKIYLCGTKYDLLAIIDRAVPVQYVKEFAKTIDAKDYETSSKDINDEYIEKMFEEVITDFLLRSGSENNTNQRSKDQTITLNKTKNNSTQTPKKVTKGSSCFC